MNTKLIVVGIAGVVLVIGLLVVVLGNGNGDRTPDSGTSAEISTPNDTAESEEGEEMGETHEVVYTASGYSPDSLTISRGDSVSFRNDSSRNVWTASNPHPAHTDYPEFDSGSGIGPGQAYEFRFSRVGTWGYHNHLNPSHTATIIVQ